MEGGRCMKKLTIYMIIGLISLSIVNNPLSNQYVSILKSDSIVVGKQNNSLYQQIINKSKEYNVPASDAKLDPVWKATPGYNGIEVNIDASYKKMKKTGIFNEEKLVFDQIKPKVHLENLKAAPIYRGNPEKPMVSFIINVAWGNEYLPEMLATLKKYNVTTSFFLEGRWVKENPDLAKMISESGHEIGNHSYTHPDMKKLSASEIKNQIEKTNIVIEATTGKVCKWFGPPSGSYSEEVIKVADHIGVRTVLWSVDTIDWQKPMPETIIQRVAGKIHPGALILMHPTESTTKALEGLIRVAEQKNYQISTVSDTISEERVY